MTKYAATEQVITQRIRIRQIEYLEMVVAYEADCLPFDVNELINQWFDWNPDKPTDFDYPEPIYTPTEADLLCQVSDAINQLCMQYTDNALTALRLPQWRHFIQVADIALCELSKRGLLSEEVEIHSIVAQSCKSYLNPMPLNTISLL